MSYNYCKASVKNVLQIYDKNPITIPSFPHPMCLGAFKIQVTNKGIDS